MDSAIVLSNISKKYKIGSPRRLTDVVHAVFSSEDHKEFWALEDVNLRIKKGETVGIIGSNGSGKSTLLRILSGITYPTKGFVVTHGKVASLLELGAGFHPELTGRENVFLNGMMLGLNSREIKKQFDQIIEFSGIGKFLDTPIKHYSSGMYVRLAFSVAAHLRSEILLVDEVLGVGDLYFQQKAQAKLEKMCREGVTMIIASHDLKMIENFCSKVIVLEGGKIIKENKTSKALNYYIKHITQETFSFYCRIEKVEIIKKANSITVVVWHKTDPMIASVGYAVAVVITKKGRNIFAKRDYFLSGTSIKRCDIVLNTKTLPPGKYNLTVNITDKDVTKMYAIKENVHPFVIKQ